MVQPVTDAIFARIDGRRIIFRPDELNLHIAPIGERETENRIGRLAAIAHILECDILHEEKRPDSHDLGPMADRRIKVFRHPGHLHHRPKRRQPPLFRHLHLPCSIR